jgi:pimeloyl-ACP methyl ester carboxylesterase
MMNRAFKFVATGVTIAMLLGGTALAESVILPNGVEISYEKHGDGERSLILIHGFSFAKEIWERVIPHIDAGWTIYAYDLKGFGDSSKAATGYDYPSMVAELDGFMDELGIESAVFAGHSLGGMMLQDFAVANPERVEGLVLSDVQARNEPPIGITEPFAQYLAAFGDEQTNRALFAAGTPMFFKAENLTPEDLNEIVSMNVKSPTVVLRQSFTNFLTAPAIEPADWAKLTEPTLVVATTHDVVDFSVAVHLLDTLPQADLVVIPRSGHTPMWEKPIEFAGALNEFLESLP